MFSNEADFASEIFRKYRNSGNISNFKIYIIWISVNSKTDFYFQNFEFYELIK